MTAIIVVVVVALVFFVAVCVIALMVWKRESEMRTDSIKAIEENLERLAQELSHESDDADGLRRETEKLREAFADRNVNRNIKEDLAYVESVMSEREQGGTGRSGSWDPFDWVRDTGTSEQADAVRIEPEYGAEASEERPEKTDSADAASEHAVTVEDTAVTASDMEEAADTAERADVIGAEDDASYGFEEIELPDIADMDTADIDIDEAFYLEEDIDVPYDDGEGPDAGYDEGHAEGTPEYAEPEATDERINGQTDVYGDGADDIYEDEDTWQADDEDGGYAADDEDTDGHYGEIDLDSIEDIGDIDDLEPETGNPMGYDVGRSGRKYTESELESLIKE